MSLKFNQKLKNTRKARYGRLYTPYVYLHIKTHNDTKRIMNPFYKQRLEIYANKRKINFQALKTTLFKAY